MTVLIPDVSEFQTGSSAPNWPGIAAQNGGAGIIRVGYGITHLDQMFVSNYTQMKSSNFQFMGLYHYLRQDQDALAQARAFCNWVGPVSALVPNSIPILDLEEGSGDQSGRANTWLNFVDHFYGLDKLPLNMRSWLYSGDNFARTQGLVPIFNSARHTWVASYGSVEPSLPHTLWQSTDGAIGSNRTRWAGAGFCDTSIFHGQLSDLKGMTVQPSTPPTPTSPALKDDEMQISNDRKFGAVSFQAGQFAWIAFFCDPGGEGKQPNVLRVAPWAGSDFAGITTVTVGPQTQKVTVNLPASCSGISFQRQDDPSNWATIAYNLGPVS